MFPEQNFLLLLKILNWITFYFSDIGLHFGIVEYSSPIKRMKAKEVNGQNTKSITRTHLTSLNHLKYFLDPILIILFKLH